jgi:hypothetical protein
MNNDYTIVGEHAAIHLPDGRVALIDASALGRAQAWQGTWYADDRKHTSYVMIGTRTPMPEWKRTTRYLHRVVMDAPSGLVVDHRDGDGLVNTSANLRIVTQGQNLQNRKGAHSLNKSSGVRGVTRSKNTRQPWRARCVVDGVEYSLGRFDTIEEAAVAAAAGRARLMTHSSEATSVASAA